MEQQWILRLGCPLEIPGLLLEEVVVLRGDAEGSVVRDVHGVGGKPPRDRLAMFDPDLRLELPPPILVFIGELGRDLERIPEVHARHGIRVCVVVDQSGVLVGSGHPVDVEVVRPIEAQVQPEFGSLEGDLRPHRPEELAVSRHLDVLADGVDDVGVDVVLGGPCQEIRRSLFAVDGSPGEEDAVAGQGPRPSPGVLEHAVTVGQDGPGHGRVRVDEERQDVDLGVPEVVAVVGVARESLGRDAGITQARGVRVQLEEGPSHGPLCLDVRAFDDDVVCGPESGHPAFLVGGEVFDATILRCVEDRADLQPFIESGGLAVGRRHDELVDRDAGERGELPCEFEAEIHRRAMQSRRRRRPGDLVIHTRKQSHAGVGGDPGLNESGAVERRSPRLQDPLTELLGESRIRLRRRVGGLVEAVAEARHDRHLRRPVDGQNQPGGDDIGHLERHEPEEPHLDGHTGAGLPCNVAFEDTTLDVQPATAADDLHRGEVEWFPIDGDLDERSVGDRHHRLSDLGEPVCLLGMGDRPRLVEAVEVGADDVMGGALVE